MIGILPAFGRVLGLIVGAPLLGQRGIPVQVKVGLALFITGLFVPIFTPALTGFAPNLLQEATLFAGELLIGLAIGFIARLTFAAVQIAGHMVEVPMGLAMASVFDPAQGGQMPVFGQLYYVLVAQVFFLTDGHLGILRVLGESFRTIPAGQVVLSEQAAATFFASFAWMFTAGVQVALPVAMAVLLTDAALGVAMRVVPQFNIFMIGFSVKIITGLLAATICIVALLEWAAGVFSGNGQFYQQLMGFIQGLR